MKVKPSFGGEVLMQFLYGMAIRTARPFSNVRYEDEHIRYDPKDGELYLSRVKPGETLVEARSGLRKDLIDRRLVPLLR